MTHLITLAEPLVEQPALLKQFHGEFHELSKVSTQRVVRIQTQRELTDQEKTEVQELLLNGSANKVKHGDIEHAKLFEVAYRPALLDPEHIAVEKILSTLPFGAEVQAVKFATVYVLEGLTEEDAKALVHKYLYNDLLQVIIHPDQQPTDLMISHDAEVTEIVAGFRDMNLRQLKELSETRSLYMEDHYLLETQRKFKEDLQRDPSDAELEYLAQRTSDHCFHTTWKSLGLFKKLKSEVDKVLPNRPDIVSVFVDNSGVMAVDEQNSNTTYMIKGETHNSPTAIAPVGGVETMHGGCLRDIMGTGQGGYPTMATQVFIIGDQTKEEMAEEYQVDQFLDPLVILRGMVQGVQNYGNPMGVPNFGGRIFRHPQFFGKPLALGICLGIGEKEYSKIGTPEVGDIALLVGNPTGRDGIHGATMSSAANSEEQVQKEGAAVQIGDPYTERLIMEATPELRTLVRAYGDLGAGGIASCFGEMAEGVGIEMDLADIPVKYEGLSPWEKLESESQERMGMAIAPENLEKVQQILDHHEVPYHQLGTFTGSKRLVVKHGEETIVDLDYEWLEGFPVPQKKVEQFVLQHQEVTLDFEGSIEDATLKIISHPDTADQSLFTRRWDSTVHGRTLRESCAPFTNMPFDQGITVPVEGSSDTQVLSLTVNPWWAGNPYNMAQATFIGTVSKQIAAGVPRNKIAMCDNFYTPKSRPEVDYHLTEMVRAITELMVDLDTPMISGKDSSSGTTKIERRADGKIESLEIAPVICMSAMGAGKSPENIPAKALQTPGNKLFFVPAGIRNDDSASLLLDDDARQKHFNYEVDIQEYTKTIDTLSKLIEQKKVKAISVTDDGGILQRVFEMMLGSGCGADLSSFTPQQEDLLSFLSKVVPGSFIIEASSAEELSGIEAIELGEVTEEAILKVQEEKISLEKMTKSWQQTWYDILKLPRDVQDVLPPAEVTPFIPQKTEKKLVKVVYTPGINNHNEMARAWRLLGCDVQVVSATDTNATFADADIVAFPGGFADGDYLGAAKVWDRVMWHHFSEQMQQLIDSEKPVIGICNGFQLMTRAGFFGKGLALVQNDSAVFEQRWTKLRFTENCDNSIWTKGLAGQELIVPLAHGYGKFVKEGALTDASIALQYAPNSYPNNPNGSPDGIAAVFAGSRGQFFGGMPHPERAIESFHHSEHGLLFFQNLLRNLS